VAGYSIIALSLFISHTTESLQILSSSTGSSAAAMEEALS
jgi:hypothetical protein